MYVRRISPVLSSLNPITIPTQARQPGNVGIEHVRVGVVKVVGDVFLEPGAEVWAGVRSFERKWEEVFLVRYLGSGFSSRSIVRWRSEVEIGLSDDLAERRKRARGGRLTMTNSQQQKRYLALLRERMKEGNATGVIYVSPRPEPELEVSVASSKSCVRRDCA
jgi:hypothetical protein